MCLGGGSHGHSPHLLCQCDPSVSGGGVQDTHSLRLSRHSGGRGPGRRELADTFVYT